MAACGLVADRLRAGHIIKDQNKYWRVISNGRSQKGQGAASYHLKCAEVVGGKVREFTVPPGKDFPEARTERLKLLFSGFDDDDRACFVFPQHASNAGQEVNIPAASLSEQQQKYLCCGMPVDILHIQGDEEEAAASGGDKSTDIYCDIMMPSSYVYTVEKLGIKGMYKIAHFVEADGNVTVSEHVQPGDKIKVVIRSDGTSSFQGKI